MAERRCALCGQPLPAALTQIEIESRLKKLSTPALAEERRRLQGEFEHRLLDERERARRLAEKDLRHDIYAADRRVKTAEAKAARQLKEQAIEFDRKIRYARQGARREVESELKGEIKVALKRANDAEAGARKSIEKATTQTEQPEPGVPQGPNRTDRARQERR